MSETMLISSDELRRVARCDRCRRRVRGSGDGWNITLRQGVVTGFLCPECQTPEENAEAEINEATLTYGHHANGCITGAPKGFDGKAIPGTASTGPDHDNKAD